MPKQRPPGRSAWIFQSNPKYFDLRSALLKGKPFTWKLDPGAQSIKVGDEVFMWQSKPGGGILGVLEVIDGPGRLPLQGAEFRSETAPAYHALRVLLNVESVLQTPVSIEEFKSVPILKNMRFLRTRLPMQRRLEPLEAEAINRLIYLQGRKLL